MAIVGLTIDAWRMRRRCPLITFAMGWLLVALSIRFVLPMPEYLHEQHLYVPLIGLWIALGATIRPLMRLGGINACPTFAL